MRQGWQRYPLKKGPGSTGMQLLRKRITSLS